MGFKQLHHCEPAAKVVAKLGGVCALAKELQGTPGMVTRWMSEAGTGGRIPSKHHKRILEIAKQRQIDISPADIIGV
jgi:hypothetical protein